MQARGAGVTGVVGNDGNLKRPRGGEERMCLHRDPPFSRTENAKSEIGGCWREELWWEN
jgi:hypothetical protein